MVNTAPLLTTNMTLRRALLTSWTSKTLISSYSILRLSGVQWTRNTTNLCVTMHTTGKTLDASLIFLIIQMRCVKNGRQQLSLLTMTRAALTWPPVLRATAGKSSSIILRPTRSTHASKPTVEIDSSASGTTTNKTEDIWHNRCSHLEKETSLRLQSTTALCLMLTTSKKSW